MMTPKQWQALTDKRRRELFSSRTFIPRNTLRIRSGYYTDQDLGALLRQLAHECDGGGKRRSIAERILYLLDMMSLDQQSKVRRKQASASPDRR